MVKCLGVEVTNLTYQNIALKLVPPYQVISTILNQIDIAPTNIMKYSNKKLPGVSKKSVQVWIEIVRKPEKTKNVIKLDSLDL